MVFPFLGLSYFEYIIRKIKRRFSKPVKIPPDHERTVVELADEGESISVEMALNSRCTSDYDENPKNFHWGMFDKTKKLADEQIEKIVQLSKIPRFTNIQVGIQAKANILTFVVNDRASAIQRDWAMVESGMQQQAAGLICAALGVGMVFRNQGKDGTALSDTDFATVKFKLDAMKPSYNSSFWSSLPPSEKRPWRKGNLPDPVRDGTKPFISALENLKTENRSGRKSTDEAVSQLLWAARGRTPHYYKSRPWGMSIPTWAGEQGISTVFALSHNTLYKYINWGSNRPTHTLSEVQKIDEPLFRRLLSSFSANHALIVLGKNEDFARALWEIGYQLLNLLLQAHSLGISYRGVLLDEAQRSTLGRMGIGNPIALLVT